MWDNPDVVANNVSLDGIDAGACARVRPKDYRQAKGGLIVDQTVDQFTPVAGTEMRR